ncbi:nuclear transport factor 2 family protein [Pseudomonas aeruginosa]|uniref:nuclear transport factor 2 family protein n=1 Tax=Pseudomonas aeruginosa TaxID=287 RepID=UPI000F83C0CC|nr:nuclear transport factor 2 family protein [Pseudomonas aeruginosa]RTR53449.1 nuclear transport factor 2 family protein [Pseudomonas aeruginosa]
MTDIRETLLALEADRQRALVEEDLPLLSDLFADDLLYVHTTGLVQDKTQYLDYVRDVVRYLAVDRGDLTVQVLGDGVALMSGSQVNLLQKRGGEESVRAEGFVTQTWVRGEQGWRISSFHGTRT